MTVFMAHPPPALRAPGPVLQQLRQHTAAAHRQTEQLLDLSRLATRPGLVSTLQVFDAFLADWEPRLARALPSTVRTWFERHRRGAWAEQDLRALGSPRLAPLRCPDLPLACPSAALGSLYVLEGSALGGRVIARQLHERLGITPASGGRYFGGRGEDTGRIWRECCQHLERETTDLQQACSAAERTFAELGRLFRQRLDALP